MFLAMNENEIYSMKLITKEKVLKLSSPRSHATLKWEQIKRLIVMMIKKDFH